MYESYFGLTERPFSIAPDPQYLYMSSRHKEAMGHLSYGLSQGGCFIVLTGEVGTGKTTLCRNLLSDLPDNVDVALILNANINEQELLQTICDEFEIDYSQETSQKQLLDSINTYLLETFAENRHAVLIIDEAQLLSRDVLEQIRLLTNLETTKAKLLQIILIGQPELNDVLTRNDLRQLAQRVTARYHLGALQGNEIEDYVNFRLSVAGCKKPLFSRQALHKLHSLSEGIPRKINVLADHSLLAAYSKGEALVDAKIVKAAASDVFIENGPSADAAGKRSWWLKVAGIASLIALFNFALWWYFSQPPSNTLSTPSVAQPSEHKTLAEVESTESPQIESLSTDADVIGSAKMSSSPEINDNGNDVASNSQPPVDQIVVSPTVNTGNDGKAVAPETQEVPIKPGSVVLSDELLDYSTELANTEPSSAAEATDSVANIDQQVADAITTGSDQTQTLTTSSAASGVITNNFEPVDSSAFARFLETSADLTGRVTAFKQLASVWNEQLPSQLIKPICEEFQQRGLHCLFVTDWHRMLNYNRPTVLVVSHQDKLHRVVLREIKGQQASLLVGDEELTVDLAELQSRWTREAVLLWRPNGVNIHVMALGAQGKQVLAAREQLNKSLKIARIPLLNSVESPTYDLNMGQRVFALQTRFNISRDSKIGNETNLLMNEMIAPESTPILRNRLQ